MKMLKYRCQLCGRIHYSTDDLKPGYCTTCGPKGLLILDIDWNKISSELAKAYDEGRKAYRDFAEVTRIVAERNV